MGNVPLRPGGMGAYGAAQDITFMLHQRRDAGAIVAREPNGPRFGRTNQLGSWHFTWHCAAMLVFNVCECRVAQHRLRGLRRRERLGLAGNQHACTRISGQLQGHSPGNSADK